MGEYVRFWYVSCVPITSRTPAVCIRIPWYASIVPNFGTPEICLPWYSSCVPTFGTPAVYAYCSTLVCRLYTLTVVRLYAGCIRLPWYTGCYTLTVVRSLCACLWCAGCIRLPWYIGTPAVYAYRGMPAAIRLLWYAPCAYI